MINLIRGTHRQFPSPILESLLVLAGVTVLFYCLFSSTFDAQFYIYDDHEIPRFAVETPSLWDVSINFDVFVSGRFRPVYWIFRLGELAIFGTNLTAWHLTTTILGILTCFLFYLTIRSLKVDIISSLIFILVLGVSGKQNVIWFELGPNETLGMFFTAGAGLAMAKAAQKKPGGQANFFDALALIAMTLAGLTKESFILIIPAMLLLRLTWQHWFHPQPWTQTAHTLRVPLILGTLIFVIELAIIFIVLKLRPTGYGANVAGLSLSAFTPDVWYTVLTAPDVIGLTRYLPVFGAILLIVYGPSPTYRPYLAAGVLIFAAWVIPQLVLYHQAIFSRYLWPMLVALAAVMALSLSTLWRKRWWVLWLPLLIMLFFILVQGVSITIRTATNYTARTQALHQMITFLAQTVSPDQSIVMVADPYVAYEETDAIEIYLQHAGVTSAIYLYPLMPPNGYSLPQAKNLAQKKLAESLALDTLVPDKVGAIIVLKTPQAAQIPPWFGASQWQENLFTVPFYEFSFKELRPIEVGEITYRVLTR